MSADPAHAEHTLDHLRRVGRHNVEQLVAAATLLVDHIRNDGLVFTAGAGHSLAGVMESFYRAGGLAAVHPLYHPELLPLHGATSSSGAERRSGFAREVLDEAGFRHVDDLLVVFSNSGINPYPVELARTVREAGAPVIALTSPAASATAPRRAGSTLAEQADIVLDTLVPPGDSSYPVTAPVTAPLSSLTNTHLWNLLLVQAHEIAEVDGIELPVWCSANVHDGDEANANNLARYEPRIPGLR